MVQDGKVEGGALISCKSTDIAIEQLSTEELEPTKKKDTLRSKTKEKLQQDRRRGTIMIKSNPIPMRRLTLRLEDNNTKEVLALL